MTSYKSAGRVFLETSRFDRVGSYGRLPLISLTAVDNEYFGYLDNWVACAERLEEQKMISREDADQIKWLHTFGGLIANTDMHFGNISLIYCRNGTFELAPAYDMLPMFYRPTDGSVPQRDFIPPGPHGEVLRQWDSALECAVSFWRQAAEDERLSDSFREISAVNLVKVQALQGGPRLIVS